ncbi:unnamed protein product [Arabis nemorensis]|uniref:Transmembrane protein n=1 Tax=Arabis nemorensis TaxID=586526 RepID=A0A565ANX6_9BRAS|nr:unnamed protein product [Arabis nemorensis]
MASINLLLIVLLVLVSLSVTSVYSLSTRDAVSKQDYESYLMATTTSDQGSSMIDVEDLAKARSLQDLVAGSKVVVNKKSKSSSTKNSKKKKKRKSKKVGSSALVGIIIVAIVVTIAIIFVLYYLYLRHKIKKCIGHATEQTKTEDYV